jgi:hypothetical protein
VGCARKNFVDQRFSRFRFYSTLSEGVYDFQPVNVSHVLHIFGENHAASGLFGCPKNQSIPERKPVEPVQVDRGENIGYLGGGDIEFGQQLNLAADNVCLYAEFPCGRDKIFLENLKRHNPGPRAPVFRHKIKGPALFRRRRLVISVDQDVRIEEATSAHESHPD